MYVRLFKFNKILIVLISYYNSDGVLVYKYVVGYYTPKKGFNHI